LIKSQNQQIVFIKIYNCAEWSSYEIFSQSTQGNANKIKHSTQSKRNTIWSENDSQCSTGKTVSWNPKTVDW